MVFTKRLQQLGRQYGDQAVLDVFPLCLKGEACDWYTHLSDEITDRMQRSMSECISQIERRFKKNVFEARREADKLKFRFATEKELSLREYIERKTMLLREANITDEADLAYRIWQNLDATLMNSIYPEDYSLEEFVERLYRQEIPARLQWSQINRGSSSSRPLSSRYSDNKPTSRDSKGTPKETTAAPVPADEERPRYRPKQCLRNCRHCGGEHFDFDCPTRKPAVRAYFIQNASASDTAEEDQLSEADKQMLRNLRASTQSPHTSSSDESKN
jgi:hypothetical protein